MKSMKNKKSMKKWMCVLLVLLLVGSISGCQGAPKQPATSSISTQVSNALANNSQSGNVQDDNSKGNNEPVNPVQENSSQDKNTENSTSSEYDVDLTIMSSTMVYSEVANMMMAPANYIGKKVRMGGQFALYETVDTEGNLVPDQIYFACIIADATACCSQGLEFVLAGDYAYPEDYPKLGEEIVVSGVFETYYEGEYMYCHLVDAVMEA